LQVLRHGANLFPSGKSFFPDAETVGFLSGNEEFFLLARKSINYEEAYLNTLTNNPRRLTPPKGKRTVFRMKTNL
jgi:hypothetical protein